MKKLIEYAILSQELEDYCKENNFADKATGAVVRMHLKECSINQEHYNWMVDQLSDKYKEPMTKKQKMIEAFNHAIDGDYKFIVIDLTVPNSCVYETIIIRNPNFKNKLEYYKKAYDDNLILKTCKDIEIRQITATNELSYGNDFTNL